MDNETRQILEDIELRKSNFERDIVIRQRNRRLKEISSYLYCIRSEGYDSELLKVRQLVSKHLNAAGAEIQKNVEKQFQAYTKQERTPETIIHGSAVYTTDTTTKKLSTKLRSPIPQSSRLLQRRSSPCKRCETRQERQQQRVVRPEKKSVPARRPLRPETKISVNSAQILPRVPATVLPVNPPPPPPPPPPPTQAELPRLANMPPPNSFSWLQRHLHSEGLRSLAPTLSQRPVGVVADDVHLIKTRRGHHKTKDSRNQNLAVIPLGLIQSDMTSRRSAKSAPSPMTSSIATNVGLTVLRASDATGTGGRSCGKPLAVQQLPSVNIRSFHVDGRSGSGRTNSKYVEFGVPSVTESKTRQEIPVVQRLSPWHSNPVSGVNDSVDPMETARKLVEEELVELFLAELNLKQANKTNVISPEEDDSLQKNMAETTAINEPKIPSEILEEKATSTSASEKNSPLSSSNHTENDFPVDIPYATPAASPLLDDSPSPPPPRTPTPSLTLLSVETANNDPVPVTITAADMRIATPIQTSPESSFESPVVPPLSAAPPSKSSVEVVNEADSKSDSSLPKISNPGRVSVSGQLQTRQVDDLVEPVSKSGVTNQSQSDHSEQVDDYSLGQVRLVSMRTLLRLLRRGHSGRACTPDDNSSDGADDLESDQDFVDLTSSTTLSEGEVWIQAPSAASKRSQLALLNEFLRRRQLAGGDSSQAMSAILYSGDVRDEISRRFLRPNVESSRIDSIEASLGEVGRLNRTLSTEDGRTSLGEACNPSTTSASLSPSEGEILLSRD